MKKWKNIMLIILILISKGINGQVVNIEKKRKASTDGFQGVIGIGFQLLDNGKKVMQFTNNIDLQYKTGAHTILLINDLSLMTIDDESIVNSGFQHIRYNYTIKDSSFLTLEILGQHQYNPIKLLSQRLIAGIGPRFRLSNTEKAMFYLGSPVLYEYEKLSDINTSITELIRLDMYASISMQLTKHLKLNSITYYQPDIKRFADFRISSETIFTFKITDKLEFNTGFEATYDSEPPDDIQQLFYYWRNKLSYSF
jgi:putative salt-induced outer membrane protein YdiY